jgi:hypothetical protein
MMKEDGRAAAAADPGNDRSNSRVVQVGLLWLSRMRRW